MPLPQKRRSPSPASYRSGLESSIADQLKKAGIEALYEPGRIEYIAKPRHYTPDFVLPNGIVIETKGYFLASDRAKHLLLQKQYPAIDLRFVFTNPNTRLTKGSKTSYGQWATTHGFQWARTAIPEDWLKESPNLASLDAIKEILKPKK